MLYFSWFCIFGGKFGGQCQQIVCTGRIRMTKLLLGISAADKQKATDQNSSSESEQYLVALGLARLQAMREKNMWGSTARKADGSACCSFLVLLRVFSLGLICRLLVGWGCLAQGRDKVDLPEVPQVPPAASWHQSASSLLHSKSCWKSLAAAEGYSFSVQTALKNFH